MPDIIAKSDPPGRAFLQVRRAMQRRPLTAGLLLLALVSLIFLVAPGLDLAVSRHFYQSTTGFRLERDTLIGHVRDAGSLLEWGLALAVVAPILVKIAFPDARLLLRPRATLFVLATLAIGPGLIVNGILKAHWGRARPHTIIEFGGNAVFSPVWWISDQCQRNCSFVSGEAASAFWLVALAFIVRKEWRPAAAIAALGLAAAISFTRIAVGAHFLSDILLAWLMTLCVMIALDRAVLKGLPEAFDRNVENCAERLGRAFRGLASRRTLPPAE